MLLKGFALGAVFSMAITFCSWSQTNAFTWKDKDTLVVNDGMSEQTYYWKDGTLSLIQAQSLRNRITEVFPIPIPDRTSKDVPIASSYKIHYADATDRTSGYSQLDLHSEYNTYEVVRSLRVYHHSAGIE